MPQSVQIPLFTPASMRPGGGRDPPVLRLPAGAGGRGAVAGKGAPRASRTGRERADRVHPLPDRAGRPWGGGDAAFEGRTGTLRLRDAARAIRADPGADPGAARGARRGAPQLLDRQHDLGAGRRRDVAELWPAWRRSGASMRIRGVREPPVAPAGAEPGGRSTAGIEPNITQVRADQVWALGYLGDGGRGRRPGHGIPVGATRR